MSDYDLAIVGSGGAAFVGAIKARGLGARVVMIERGTLGGTCLNVGCIPSKTLLRAADIFRHAAHHPFAGVNTAACSVDFARVVQQKDELIAGLRQQKYADLIEAYGWDLVRGEARFIDAETIGVDGRSLRAGAYLIATGSSPVVPAIPGLASAGYLTSATALSIERVPASLVVIGAGYVGLELGRCFAQLGSQVTVLKRRPRLLGDYEPEVGESLGAALGRLGMRILTGVKVTLVEATAAGRRVTISRAGNEQIIEAEEVLVAAGRRPDVGALDMPAAGATLDGHGGPVLDSRLQSSNARVYAAGDVTGGPQFVYVAAYEGGVAAENALAGAETPIDLAAVPGVIFTDPQVATVGLTREQAAARGSRVQATCVPLSLVHRGVVNRETDGIFVIVADEDSRRILGAQIVSSNAGDAIYAATLAVKLGLTVDDLVSSFAPYLTMAEGLRLAAVAFDRDPSKLSCCA